MTLSSTSSPNLIPVPPTISFPDLTGIIEPSTPTMPPPMSIPTPSSTPTDTPTIDDADRSLAGSLPPLPPAPSDSVMQYPDMLSAATVPIQKQADSDSGIIRNLT